MPTTTTTRGAPLSAKAVPEGYTLEPLKLEDNFQETYFTLRWGIAVLGILLPVLLVGVAWVRAGISAQGSMSAYYYAGNGVVRDIFVGVLIAVGASLVLYRGFSQAENIALNLAGVFAAVVAMFPMEWQCGANCSAWSVHGVAAVLFFLCIAYVCLVRAADTLVLLSDDKKIRRYKATYYTIGALMIASPFAAVIVSAVLRRQGTESIKVLLIEWFGVWVFAAYWIAKSIELRETSATERAARGEFKRATRHRRFRFDDAIIVPQ